MEEEYQTSLNKNTEANKNSSTEDCPDLKKDKKNDSNSLLKYSLTNSQNLRKSCTSSPDIELLHKKLFSKGVSPSEIDITLLNNSDYFSEESDESFVKMENYLKGSNYNNQTRPEIHEKSHNFTINSENDRDEDLSISVEIAKIAETSQNVSKNTSEVSFNHTLTFNDTIEEMEYYLKHGPSLIKAAQKLDEKNQKANEFVNDNIKISDDITVNSENENKQLSSPDIKFASKVEKKVKNHNKNSFGKKTPRPISRNVTSNLKSNQVTDNLKVKTVSQSQPLKQISNVNKQPSYSHKTTPFKIPLKEKSTPKTAEKKLKVNYSTRKYDNVMSPIAYYIKNSPMVPMVKNVSPARNYWDRVPPGPLLRDAKLKKIAGKENSELPEKAYKSPKVTKIVQHMPSPRLPPNKQVTNMANSIPKPLILKHVKREKLNETSQSDRKSDQPGIEDSFSHLTVKSMDVSHCIAQVATLIKTPKKQK